VDSSFSVRGISSPTLDDPVLLAFAFALGGLLRLKKGNHPYGCTYRTLDDRVIGRSDYMINIWAMSIFPSQVGEILDRHLGIG
jgi:phenylacetate-coenzyme A ligase PaaK-like adenylate-forming protein